MDDLCRICGLPDVPDPGKHNPAAHVAKTFHIPDPNPVLSYHVCISCAEPWPCPTRDDYGGPEATFYGAPR